MSDLEGPLRYRLITGPDDAEFCRRVSGLLDRGYRLHGSPALTFDGVRVIAAQALVLAEPADPEAVAASSRVAAVGTARRAGPSTPSACTDA